MSSSVRITEIVDKVPVSNFQRRAIAICLALAFADGINVLSIGYAIPSLADSYGVAAADFSIVVMAALIGEILSNFLIAPLADRYGRKRIMGLGIVVFGLAAIPSFFASSILALAACRFVAGIGIGAAVPNGFALGNEYPPTRLKATTVTVLSSGTAVGGLVVGLIASRLVPLHGGETLLLVAGVIPLVILVATCGGSPSRSSTSPSPATRRRSRPSSTGSRSARPTARTPSISCLFSRPVHASLRSSPTEEQP
ncbi:MFS transporter [Rhodococcus sp. NPDC059968]|uniref:MFS transporter n=1 Tax=Rhodococcus sp. NPDC059968 TaxID=3347017 RepID=UPI00366E30F0